MPGGAWIIFLQMREVYLGVNGRQDYKQSKYRGLFEETVEDLAVDYGMKKALLLLFLPKGETSPC